MSASIRELELQLQDGSYLMMMLSEKAKKEKTFTKRKEIRKKIEWLSWDVATLREKISNKKSEYKREQEVIQKRDKELNARKENIISRIKSYI